LNTYQYIPPFSNHPPAVFKGFIKGELIRYIRTNTCRQDFDTIKSRFMDRLTARGYSKR
ncbi:hypothetical protein BC828DRAFT_334279, partial [Blastocladiella britannica]